MKVDWSDKAVEVLESLHEHYQKRFGIVIADTFVDRIFSRIEILEQFPEIGAIEQSQIDNNLTIRYLVEGNYKIVYEVNKTKGFIEILTVFDTRQNPSKMLAKE